ncbi:MAG: GGDEF domain-containing protein [Spirochaetota bacterium]
MIDAIDILKDSLLFSKLKPAALQLIAKYSNIVKFNDNETIFTEGSIGDSLYIVNSGGVRIIKKTDDNKKYDIAKFIKGELFGELDLFENVPRNASAVAEQDTALLIFPKKGKKFTDILKKHPEIFANILHELIAMTAHRIRETNKLVSEKTKWIEELRGQLLFDKLTGMYNRSYLTDEFNKSLAASNICTGILFIKPDNFKYINDTFGHAAGDATLLHIADAIKSGLKDNEIGIRYRSDEFIVVSPDTTIDKAIMRGKAILNVINNIDMERITNGKKFNFTTSIGISIYPQHSTDPVMLVEIAFNKMMEIRANGGNKVLSA